MLGSAGPVGWSRQGNAAVPRAWGHTAGVCPSTHAARELCSPARGRLAGTGSPQGWPKCLVPCCCLQYGWLQLCRAELSGRCLGLTHVLVGSAVRGSAGAASTEPPLPC